MGEHGRLAGEQAASGQDDLGKVLQGLADMVDVIFQIDVDGLGVQGGWGQNAVPVGGVPVGGVRGR